MLPVLDINDASLGLWQDDSLALSSPGYALLEGKDYHFGLAAREKARLLPRQINHRYWAQLDTEPMVPAFGPSRHSADLVHAHLLSIHEGGGRPDNVIIAAPGSLQLNQLSLLLGIAEQCPFSVTGLVDRAVAACAGHPVADYNWHVELQLNQALLTGMRLENGQLVRDNLVPIPGSGWLALQDALARAIADAFIRQTRFDPRRSASNEQSLYDALPGILERLETASETNIDLDGRQARVERATRRPSSNCCYPPPAGESSIGTVWPLLHPTHDDPQRAETLADRLGPGHVAGRGERDRGRVVAGPASLSGTRVVGRPAQPAAGRLYPRTRPRNSIVERRDGSLE